MIKKHNLCAVATLAFATLAAQPLRAQVCIGPDNLDGACCEPAQLNIPSSFPGFDIPSLGICWDDCDASTNNTRFRVLNVNQVACGRFTAFTDVCTPFGIAFMSGIASLDYTRTWEEVNPTTLERFQVWRFLTKVSLFPSGSSGICPRPPCLDVFQQAFYYGYVDWAQNCATGAWSQVAMLFHNCDLFIHNSLSAQPAPSHPQSVYGVVAPHTGANPFAPTPTFPAPAGGLTAEAVRTADNPFGPTLCVKEEPVTGGTLLPLAYGCLCGTSSAFLQSANFLDGASACGSSFGSLFIPSAFPTVPWIHMVSTSIGSWTTSATYPGQESVFANEGLFRYLDGCSSDLTVEVRYGATTTGGWALATPGLTTNFVDLADNYSQPLSGSPTLPVVGTVQPTDHLIYVNTP